MLFSEIHYITCLECGEEFPYEFSKEKVENWGKPSLENMKHGEIRSGIIPLVTCKNCGKKIQVPNFKPHNN
jgi:uncharacterized Zn finger protein